MVLLLARRYPDGVSRLIGVALVLVSATASAGPSGRVIRVERSAGARAVPRLCEIHGDAGNCVGDEPRAGQTVTVLDEHHVLAEVKIVEVASFSPTCPVLWTIKTRVIRSGGAEIDGVGVIDPGLDPARAHLIDRGHLPPSPSGAADEVVWRAVDRDGDGDADILITRFGCDSSSRPVSGDAPFCMDVWARTGTRMARTTQLNFARCNR
jgi:hypothetical protein